MKIKVKAENSGLLLVFGIIASILGTIVSASITVFIGYHICKFIGVI